MLNVELDEVNGIAILSPNGALSEKDFKSASSVIDQQFSLWHQSAKIED